MDNIGLLINWTIGAVGRSHLNMYANFRFGIKLGYTASFPATYPQVRYLISKNQTQFKPNADIVFHLRISINKNLDRIAHYLRELTCALCRLVAADKNYNNFPTIFFCGYFSSCLSVVFILIKVNTTAFGNAINVNESNQCSIYVFLVVTINYNHGREMLV